MSAEQVIRTYSNSIKTLEGLTKGIKALEANIDSLNKGIKAIPEGVKPEATPRIEKYTEELRGLQNRRQTEKALWSGNAVPKVDEKDPQKPQCLKLLAQLEQLDKALREQDNGIEKTLRVKLTTASDAQAKALELYKEAHKEEEEAKKKAEQVIKTYNKSIKNLEDLTREFKTLATNVESLITAMPKELKRLETKIDSLITAIAKEEIDLLNKAIAEVKKPQFTPTIKKYTEGLQGLQRRRQAEKTLWSGNAVPKVDEKDPQKPQCTELLKKLEQLDKDLREIDNGMEKKLKDKLETASKDQAKADATYQEAVVEAEKARKKGLIHQDRSSGELTDITAICEIVRDDRTNKKLDKRIKITGTAKTGMSKDDGNTFTADMKWEIVPRTDLAVGMKFLVKFKLDGKQLSNQKYKATKYQGTKTTLSKGW